MGKTVMLSAALALSTAGFGAAQAQQPGASYPPPGAGMHMPPMPQPPMRQAPMRGGGRWGGQVGGHWWGGASAPGGWAGYRAPYRGYRLPSYWVAPRFYVVDWNRYGFSPPPQGYQWTRYYDDAVLIDGNGQVYDSRHGVDWDGGYAGDGEAMVHEHEGYRGPPGTYHERDGEHGYRREERIERRFDDRGPGRGYPQGPSTWVSENDGTTVTVTTSGSGMPPMIHLPPAAYGYGYGAGYGGGSVTTVTVQSQPVVTTTTTEIIEDRVSYARPAIRRVHVRRVVVCPPVRHWHPAPKPRWHPKPRVMGS